MFQSFNPQTISDPRARALFESVEQDLKLWFTGARWIAMKKVHDQWEGGAAALQQIYHPPIHGLTQEQQEIVSRARSHVNLVDPAIDRLVNSIHAGKITRRAKAASEAVQRALARPRYADKLAKLAENAFAYGTGFLCPIWNGEQVDFWFPNPRYTALAVDPDNVERLVGIVEMIPDLSPLSETGTAYGIKGFRFLSAEVEGTIDLKGNGRITETNWGFVPCVVAYGQDRTHRGEKYGRSLVLAAADASIKVTNNELQLELLRSRQTQALLVILGEPSRTSAEGEGKEGLQKFIQFDKKEEGDVKFVTPDSRLEQIIKVTERLCTDAAVASGLPLDAFLPERITGSDASATAARNRAFPLQQRMVRLVQSWRQIEERTVAIICALQERGTGAEIGDLEELVERLEIECQIQPSFPEAEAETLSNWQQRTEKFFSKIEDAIEYYSPHLSDEDKETLAANWRERFERDLKTKEDADKTQFLREAFLAFLGDGTVADILANLTNLRDLVDEAGLERQEAYEEPWLPVQTLEGQLVSGEVLRDASGDVVGGALVEPIEPETDGAGEPGAAEEVDPSTQLYGYHLQYGVVTINESRARLGLPPIPDGDVTYEEFTARLQQEGKLPMPTTQATNLPRRDAGADLKNQSAGRADGGT